MATITFTTGLCGSGKTHYSEALQQRTGARIFEGIGRGIVANDSWLVIIRHLNAGEDCIVEEMDFCFQNPRNEAIKYILENAPETEIKWVCFESDIESANWNVRLRTNKNDIDNHLHINKQLNTLYTYQSGAEIVPITRIETK